MRNRLLSGIDVDDLLKDWTKYCEANGMKLGGLPDETSHAVTVIAEDRQCSLNIVGANGQDAEDTLRRYLDDWQRRHPDADVEKIEDEEELRRRCCDEDHVGFIIA